MKSGIGKGFFSFLGVLGFLTSVLVSAPSSAGAQEGPPVTIGMIPGGNPGQLKKQARELAEKLQNRLGVPVNVFISKNYADLVGAMKGKKVDFAFFSSMTYVFAEKKAQAHVLLKKTYDGPYYYSALVVRTDSSLKKLSQLRGQRVAFVDKNSSSGYLYPLAELKRQKIDPDKDFSAVLFTGNHQASVQLLEQGKVDAAALFSDDAGANKGAWSKFARNPKLKVRALWVSEPIPNDPFCVREDFYQSHPEVTHSMMLALMDLAAENENSHRFAEVLGSGALTPATRKQYEPVRKMVESMNWHL